jgi:hypothetical protein
MRSYEYVSEKYLSTYGRRSLEFAEVRPGPLPLLHAVAAPRGYSGYSGCFGGGTAAL